MTDGLKLLFKGKRYDLDRVTIKLLSDDDLDNLKFLVNYEQVRRMKEKIDALGIAVHPEK